MHERRGLGVEFLRERSEAQVAPQHLSWHHTCKPWSIQNAPHLCDILLLGGLTWLAGILALHDMRADDAPVRAAYPAGVLDNELQRHDKYDGFMLFYQIPGHIMRPLSRLPVFGDTGELLMMTLAVCSADMGSRHVLCECLVSSA